MSTTTIDKSPVSVRNTPPFRADHVGSFLRPKFLLDAREQFRAAQRECYAVEKRWDPKQLRPC